MKLKRGDQIAYVPDHANGDTAHPDVELGFVTSLTLGGGGAYCRYFSKRHKGLRTTAVSELTPARYLVPYQHHEQAVIDGLLDSLYMNWIEITSLVDWREAGKKPVNRETGERRRPTEIEREYPHVTRGGVGCVGRLHRGPRKKKRKAR